jgi:hypothetical protein
MTRGRAERASGAALSSYTTAQRHRVHPLRVEALCAVVAGRSPNAARAISFGRAERASRSVPRTDRCREKAEKSSDPENKAYWSGFAEQWLRLAELADKDRS